MNKTDLKDGMRVVLRDGDEYIVAGSMIDNMDSWDSLKNYNEDLTSIEFSKLDIVEVYDWENISGESPRRKKIKVWERVPEPQMGDIYFVPDINYADDFFGFRVCCWGNSEADKYYYYSNLIFHDKSDAIECSYKMWELMQR